VAYNTFDWYDMVMAGFFTLATAVTVGIASVTLFNTAFSDALFSLGDSEITVATALSLAILGFVYVTNDNDIDSMDDFYTAALVGTIGLTLAIPLFPPVEDLVTTNDLMRSLTIAVMAIGYGAASYIK
jgi:FtsH-binding integral membrane protein